MVHARLLGPLTATVNSREIDLGSPRQRAVFAMLAMNAGRVVSREELIDGVWGGTPPVTVEGSIYTYIARLRRELEPGRPLRGRSALLVNERFGYSLQIDPDDVDAQVFGRHLERARLHEPAGAYCAAVAELNAALALWKGQALSGSVGPYTEMVRRQLSDQRFAARQDRVEYLLHLGRPADALGELSDLVRWQPLQERLRRLRMLAYYRSGRRADALAEFRSIRKLLIAELGVEPSEDLQRCHEQILRSDPALDELPALPRYHAAAGGRTTGSAPAQLPRDTPLFTGRARELRSMHALVTDAEEAGEAAVVVVSGNPGVGKSALAVRFAHELSSRFPDGHLFLDLGGQARPMPPAEALAVLLADLGHISRTLASPDRQAAMFRSALWGKRMLIVLDDASSTEQVRALLPGAPTCVVVVTSCRRLTGLEAREGARGVRLGPMPEADGVALVQQIAGRSVCDVDATPVDAAGSDGAAAHGPADDDAIRRLVRACDGLPLALRVATERVLARPEPSLRESISMLLDNELLLDLLEADDRQSSVRAALSALDATLPPGASTLLRLFGLLDGADLGLAAVAALAGTSPDGARVLLRSLVDVGVTRSSTPDRFRLTPLMHAYARERAVADVPMDDRVAAVRRLLTYYLDRTSAVLRSMRSEYSAPGEADGQSAEGAGRWCDAELDTLVAVVESGRRHDLVEAADRLQSIGRHLIDAADIVVNRHRPRVLRQHRRAQSRVATNKPRPEGPPAR